MNDTASKLSKILETKAAIKQAIIDKGIEVPDGTTFDEYPNKIAAIEGGGNNTYIKPDFFEIRTLGNTNYKGLFYEYDITTLDLSNWDTSKVTTLEYMFAFCSVVELNLSNWNTDNITNMENVFRGCWDLTSLDLTGWNTENVKYMSYLFYSCENLTDLDLSHFNTSNMTSMVYMFQDCKELTTLNLSNFDTSKVSGTISGLFNRCYKLHTLRLDNCSNDTINKIITSTGFPTDTIEGVTRKLYCKEANAAGLTAPTNWEFEYVD